MKANTLLFLRITLGLLMLIWGVDKLVHVQHGVKVAETFYMGMATAPLFLHVFGALQMLLGLVIVLGYKRRIAYPILLVITGVTMLAVWRSVVDPWGWVLSGTNALFFPSLIIFAAAFVLFAFQVDDSKTLDAGG